MAFKASRARIALASWMYEVREVDTEMKGAILGANKMMTMANPVDEKNIVR